MKLFIYIDSQTGTWGEASDLRIVDYDSLSDDEVKTLEEGADENEIQNIGDLHSIGFAAPWKPE